MGKRRLLWIVAIAIIMVLEAQQKAPGRASGSVQESHLKKSSKEIDPKFLEIESLVILPVVDARRGKKEKVKLDELQKTAFNSLKKKNYPVVLGNNMGSVGEVREFDLKHGSSEWLRNLGPSGSRWVMVVCLGDVSSELVLTGGSFASGNLSGYLFDKQTSALIWRGWGSGQAGQDGLSGTIFKSATRRDALASAMHDMVESIPKRPKPKK